MKVAAEDLWPLVMDFLEEYYSKEDFKAFVSSDSLVKRELQSEFFH